MTASAFCVAARVEMFCKFFLCLMLFINVVLLFSVIVYYNFYFVSYTDLLWHYFRYIVNSIFIELYLTKDLLLYYTVFILFLLPLKF